MLARLLTAAALTAALSAPAHAQLSKDPTLLAPFKPVVARAAESTVRIKADKKDAILGTAVDADGGILTKLSELKGATALTVKLSDGSEYPAVIAAAHKPTDLALLKIDAKLKPVTFANSAALEAGSWLASSGPTSDALSVGIVSVMTRKTTGRDALALNPLRGYLGIYPDDAKDGDGKPAGAKVAAVSPGGPAAAAGLTKDDVIFELNGKKVDSSTGLRDLLDNLRGGDAVAVKVRRKGEQKDLKVTLASAPVEALGFVPADAKDGDGNAVGVKVVNFAPPSTASRAGLAKDDVIFEVGGKKVTDQESLYDALAAYKADDTVSVKAKRKGETKSFRVRLDAGRSDIQNSLGSELSRRRTGFAEVLQTDMVVNAKDCGGPVVDLEGNVLGINIARAGRVETWVLPGEVIRPLLSDFKTGKFAVAPPKVLPLAPPPRAKGN
jgi:S1-C subfamily serine protease